MIQSEKWKRQKQLISEGSLSPCDLWCRQEVTMDPWVILPMERERHSQQFLSCGPTDGFITGTQVDFDELLYDSLLNLLLNIS